MARRFLTRLLRARLWVLRLRLWVSERLRPGEAEVTLFWAALIGALGGLASPLFRAGIHGVKYLFTGGTGSLAEVAASLGPWQRVMVPTAGGLLAGLVLHFGVHFARGKKSRDYMEAVTLGDGVIRSRPTLVRVVSSLFSIGSGGSIGREGPQVQLAALIASTVGRWAEMPRPRLRLLVACGAAAGIASAYNAPIGGALFVGEIVLGSIAMQTFGPLILSSVLATVVARIFLGGEPLFEVPRFHLVTYWELAPYLGLGLVAGAFAPWFLRLLESASSFFASWPVPVFVRMTAGGLVVGLLSLKVPDVWGNGDSAVSAILSTNLVWTALLTLLAFKLLATAATVGSGAVGGVFTPTLLVGGIMGGLFGIPVHEAFPLVTAEPNAYALVGMGAMLAATTLAPLTAIVILFEMTLDYDIVLPLMLACVTAYTAARAFGGRSIYAGALPSLPPSSITPIDTILVRDLMRADPPRIEENARFQTIVETFVTHRHHNLYVVGRDGRFRGVIPLHEIKPFLNDPELGKLAIAQDVLREEFPSVRPDSTLRETLQRFEGHTGERLPVVDEHHVLVGSISKSDLLLTLAGNRP
ncbi:MAG: ClcB-like voltage-gated chloride channel protein [Planctomycetota bacterium]|nr:ClcB-like voltage-gated chloride channel protein [Planctomycetota bacterium]